jgi:hypothetical protein
LLTPHGEPYGEERLAMLNLFLLSTLVGAVLGMRFRVTILIPVLCVALAAIAGIGVARGESPSLIATAIVLAAISLQLGYLVGSTTRFVMAASRTSRRYKNHEPSALGSGRPTLSP